MFRLVILLMLMLCGSAVSGDAAQLSQRDWMEQLADSLGLGYGLPDEPQAEDYIQLLSGERSLQVEAEEKHRRSDRVAIKRQTNFGKFSGSGWVSGRRQPVQLHLDIILPHNGRYRLSCVTRLPGVTFALGGETFTASAGSELTYQELGVVNLAAGPVEIVVTLPPGAGIDVLYLKAAPRPQIAPLDGWQPEQTLQAADLAITMLQALDLLTTLPLSDRVMMVEAERAVAQDGVVVTTDRHLGTPSGGKWVRAGHLPVTLTLPVKVPSSGCYQLQLRGTAGPAVRVTAAGLMENQVDFDSALGTRQLGSYCLKRGKLSLELELPARSGIDSLELHALDTSEETLRQLLGLPADRPLDRDTINELLQLLSSLTY